MRTTQLQNLNNNNSSKNPENISFCRWIWSTCTRSLATTWSPWASTSPSSTSASSEKFFHSLSTKSEYEPQHRVRLFSCFLCQLAFHKLREHSPFSSPTRWDILDVPATKNVELYNPEMDESKPKSEVIFLVQDPAISALEFDNYSLDLKRRHMCLVSGGRREWQVVDGHHLHPHDEAQDSLLHGKLTRTSQTSRKTSSSPWHGKPAAEHLDTSVLNSL